MIVMNLNFLDFEQPIAELQAKIEELKHLSHDASFSLLEESERLEKKIDDLTRKIFTSLTTAQKVQLARHPLRPYTSDYIKMIFTILKMPSSLCEWLVQNSTNVTGSHVLAIIRVGLDQWM